MALDSTIEKFWEEKIGHMSKMQAEFIIDTLKEKNNITNVLEIGFAGGRHTYAILKSFNVGKMVTVDIDFDYQKGRRKVDEIKSEFDNVVFVEGDSRKVLDKDFMNEHFPEGIDYVLVDGGHDYETAFLDMVNVFDYMNKDGIMIVDDYKSKVWACEQVENAVKDFSKQKQVSFTEACLEDGKGMAVFKL